jgi:hypothetical protein
MTKEYFFSNLIKMLPDGCCWGIDGLYEAKSQDLLHKFFLRNSRYVSKDIVPSWSVRISEESRQFIAEQIIKGELIHDICHQYFALNDVVYFTSYDYLASNFLLVDFLTPEFKEECLSANMIEIIDSHLG